MAQFGIAIKAGIVKDGRILTLYKSAQEAGRDPDPGYRPDLPGGRLEFGEHPYEALHREVSEETGLKIQIIQPAFVWDYVKDNSFQLVGITFYCLYLRGEVRLSEEHEHHEWLSRDELLAHNWRDADEYLAVLRLHEAQARRS